jgi:hypothetical protein
MTEDTLNALKGWPQPAAVDFHAAFSADATADGAVPPGACLHLNADGEYDLGVGTSAVMPLFNFAWSDDPDIEMDGGDPATTRGVYVGISPSGQALALPAKIAAELVSTHFVDGDYAINDHLTSPDTGDDAGKLEVGTVYTDTIVGIVSRGIVDNGYGEDAVAFWPWYIPPTA